MQLRAARLILQIIILILIIYAFLMFLSVQGGLEEAQAALADAQREAEMLQRQNQALRSSIDSETEAEVMERLARERLGLVRPEDAETNRVGD